MKTESLVKKTWDDLVFENRNKEYGAYLVRKSYSQNMTTGLGISVAMACLILLLPHFLNLLGGEKNILPIIKLPDDSIVIFDQAPSIPLPKPPPPPPSASVHSVANLTPQVTTQEVTDVIPTNEEVSNAMQSTDTGTGNVPTNSVSTGTIEVPSIPVEPEVFVVAEVMPQYEGGLKEMMKFVGRKVRYPSSAQRTGVEGTVIVSFVIDREGRVTDINVLKGISPDCDKEAVRVISLMKLWTPGMQNHKAVSVRMTLPITFHLEQ